MTTKDQDEKARALLQAARDFWESFPDSCAVRWLEDTAGQVLIFTRGEYRDTLMASIHDSKQPVEFFPVAAREDD